ncbi:hypothetical protein ABH935_003797 [Catenulispora sp. GAS73]
MASPDRGPVGRRLVFGRRCLMCGCGCGCGCWWLGCGGCGLLVGFRSFLRLRTGLRRIRWVAQFGGAPQVALAAGGVRVHDRAPVRVTAHALRGRQSSGVVGAYSQKQGLRRRLRGERHSLRGGGSRCLPAVVACGRLVPGSPSHRRLTEADRSGGIKSDHTLLWSGFVRLDTTGPVSLATPADATGNPGQPRLWERFPHLGHDNSPPPVATGWTPSTQYHRRPPARRRAHHRTAPPSGSFLNPCEAVKKRP